jgi:uncharacterized protein involved in response to NO
MTQVSDPDHIEKTAQARRARRDAMPAVLLYAFRPMFLAAGSWAALALALWLAMFFGYLQLPTRFDTLSWHIHEMLFGFVRAAVTGFLLTAIPNWTGRLPVRGVRLAVLAGLWLLGRVACLISADLPPWLGVVIDLAFPATLLAVAGREIISGKNWAQPADDGAARSLRDRRSADASRIAERPCPSDWGGGSASPHPLS